MSERKNWKRMYSEANEALAACRTEAAALLAEVLPLIADQAECVTYGYALPEDPRDFTPDAESCTPEELAAHAAAVEAWDAAGGKPEGWDAPPGSGWNEEGTMHSLRAPWGIGAYTYRDSQMCDLRDRILAVLASHGHVLLAATPDPKEPK